MTSSAFAFLMTGVLLNAGAQLLLKAGTNALGVITLTRDNWWDMFWRMGTQGHFVAGVACYMVSLRRLDHGPVARAGVASPIRCCRSGYVINAVAAHYLFGEAVTVTRWLGIGFIIARRLARRAELRQPA